MLYTNTVYKCSILQMQYTFRIHMLYVYALCKCCIYTYTDALYVIWNWPEIDVIYTILNRVYVTIPNRVCVTINCFIV